MNLCVAAEAANHVHERSVAADGHGVVDEGDDDEAPVEEEHVGPGVREVAEALGEHGLDGVDALEREVDVVLDAGDELARGHVVEEGGGPREERGPEDAVDRRGDFRLDDANDRPLAHLAEVRQEHARHVEDQGPVEGAIVLGPSRLAEALDACGDLLQEVRRHRAVDQNGAMR